MSAFQRCGESLFVAIEGSLAHASAARSCWRQVTDVEGRELRFNQRDPSVRGLIAGRPLARRQGQLWRRSS